MTAVDAVIFDWGGTLTPWHDVDLIEQWMVYARALHADDAGQAEAFAQQVLSAEEIAWRRAREEHSSSALAEILGTAGVDESHLRAAEALAAYRTFWEPHTVTDPQVRPLWEGLRERGIRVGVLSNTIWDGEYHRSLFERDGVLDLIDADVYSSEIPWTKPHPEAFRAAADAVGVDPGRAVYVGDRLFEDVYGPQQVGMRGVLVPHSTPPSNQIVAVEATPDAVVHELLDLLPVIDDWNGAGKTGGEGHRGAPAQ